MLKGVENMKYIVKFEHRPEWNAENNPNVDANWIVDEQEIDRLAIEWGIKKSALMEQVEPWGEE